MLRKALRMSPSVVSPAVTPAKIPEEIPPADVKCSMPFAPPAALRAKCPSSPEKTVRYTAAIVSQITTAEDKSKINFEDGTVNGFDTNGTSSTVSTTTDRAFKGTQSLEWKISSTVGGKAEIKLNSNKVVLAPGSTMTFRVWVPSDAPIKSIQPYIMPHDSSWLTSEWNSSWISYDNIKKGDWNECTVTLPSTTNTSLTEQQFGIQIETTAQGSFTVYVDSIDW